MRAIVQRALVRACRRDEGDGRRRDEDERRWREEEYRRRRPDDVKRWREDEAMGRRDEESTRMPLTSDVVSRFTELIETENGAEDPKRVPNTGRTDSAATTASMPVNRARPGSATTTVSMQDYAADMKEPLPRGWVPVPSKRDTVTALGQPSPTIAHSSARSLPQRGAPVHGRPPLS